MRGCSNAAKKAEDIGKAYCSLPVTWTEVSKPGKYE